VRVEKKKLQDTDLFSFCKFCMLFTDFNFHYRHLNYTCFFFYVDKRSTDKC
jgi:hypothetical protein